MSNEQGQQESLLARDGGAAPRGQDWYRKVAGVTALAGAALGAAEDAAAGIVVHTSGETVGAGVVTSPGWQLQTLYFDFYSGKTLTSPILDTWVQENPETDGHGIPTTQMLPEGFQFGLARVGPIDALFGLAPQNVEAKNHQAMIRTMKSGWTNPDNGIYYSWTLLKPLKLAAGAAIGDNPAFRPAPAREGATGLNMQTLAANGDWNSPQAGYLGLKFSPNNGVDFNYGWAEVSVNTDSTITLHRFAYNTTLNQLILAGQVGGEAGDVNQDGKVDLDDFGILKSNFGTGTTPAQGDVNNDGKVDLSDFGILKGNFGAGGAAAAVPEPNAMTLLLLGAAGLAAYRARRTKSQAPSMASH
jgi:hypothetical protein